MGWTISRAATPRLSALVAPPTPLLPTETERQSGAMNDDHNYGGAGAGGGGPGGYKLHEFVAHSTQVNCVTIGPQSNQVIATGGEDSKINLWRVDNAMNIWTLKQNKSPIECLSFDQEEQYLCSGAMNGSLKIFDLNEGKLARSLRGHQVHVTAVHYHPYGEFIVSGSYDQSMKVWDIRNKSCVQTYSGHDREITCAKFSPDGRWVCSSSKDGQLLIWDLVAGKLLKTIKLQQNAFLTSFEFNPSEFLLAGATSNRSVSEALDRERERERQAGRQRERRRERERQSQKLVSCHYSAFSWTYFLQPLSLCHLPSLCLYLFFPHSSSHSLHRFASGISR
jgi:WD40 repeat protein